MLLSEEADNLLPDWAFFVKAVVNANDLRPTASRESFYEDERLERPREELGGLPARLSGGLAEHDSSRFERFIGVHHLAIKALAVPGRRVLSAVHRLAAVRDVAGRQTVGALREQDNA